MTLEQLQQEHRTLSSQIRELTERRRLLEDQIAARHERVQQFKAAAQASPAEIDKLLATTASPPPSE